MNVIYARQPLAKSIFLADPTPRSADVPSWRPEAVRLLDEEFRFDGTVFVPEDAAGSRSFEYDDQVTWNGKQLTNLRLLYSGCLAS